jgi:hypothetical protein
METAVAGVAGWTDLEQGIARQAFDAAYGRAVAGLISAVQVQVEQLSGAESIWQLHDFLSIQRHEIEGRFDFRLPGLLFVFASLVKDGLICLDDLDGLDPDKLAKILAMSRM